jgi:hypothetical protein
MHTLLVVLLSSVGTNQLLLRADKEQNIQQHRPALIAYPHAPKELLLFCSFLQLFRPAHAAGPSLPHTIVHTLANLFDIPRLGVHDKQY